MKETNSRDAVKTLVKWIASNHDENRRQRGRGVSVSVWGRQVLTVEWGHGWHGREGAPDCTPADPRPGGRESGRMEILAWVVGASRQSPERGGASKFSGTEGAGGQG